MCIRSEKFVFNSACNFRRVTHFWLCLLETQVSCAFGLNTEFQPKNRKEEGKSVSSYLLYCVLT